MHLTVSREDIKRIWGKKFLKEVKTQKSKDFGNESVDEKILLAKEKMSKLLVFDWVKFIAVSGSVAAGFAEDSDDIDIFLVVKDNTMWLYRGIVSIGNIFHHTIRTKKDKIVKDKLCLNLISEERDLEFENDIFNFHELMYLKPIYNEKYSQYIYSKNKWLKDSYGVKNDLLTTRISNLNKTNYILKFFNSLAFVLQTLFMKISRHSPEIPRLIENSKKGKIEFFDKNYKKKKIENYLKAFKSIN